MNQTTLFSLKACFKSLKIVFSLLLLSAGVNAQINIDSLAVCYSTYLGGNSEDDYAQVKVAPDGSIYVIGLTYSSNLPVTSDAPQLNFSGGVRYNSFQTGIYDPSVVQVIPVGYAVTFIEHDLFISKFTPSGDLIFCTYWGGTGQEGNFDFHFDNQGALYIAFSSFSNDINVPNGVSEYSYGATANGANTYVTKFNSAGQVVFNTIINGLHYGQNYANSTPRIRLDGKLNNLHFDANGNIFVVGMGHSNFYVTNDAAQPTVQSPPGGAFAADVAFCKLNNSGQLTYATFWGNSTVSFGFGESNVGSCIDDQGNLIISGITSLTNFPTTSNAFQSQLSGSTDIFVAKFNNQGQIVFSTLIGGSQADFISLNQGGVSNYVAHVVLNKTDNSGNIYLVSSTYSSNFPTTLNAAYPSPQGINVGGNLMDIVLIKFSPSGNLLYSSYLGGLSQDYVSQLEIKNGSVYLAGAASKNFPSTFGVVEPVFGFMNTPSSRAFVTRLNLECQIQFSTFWGGPNDINSRIQELNVSDNGNITFSGKAGNGMIVTPGAPQPMSISSDYWNSNRFIARLNNNGQLIFSSFWGLENGKADLALDNFGGIYLARTSEFDLDSVTNTPVPDVIITPDAFQLENGFDSSVNTLNGAVSTNGQFTSYNPPYIYSGWSDVTLSIFRPLAIWEDTLNSISPSLITGCIGGPAQIITGNPILAAGAYLPQYQWQITTVDPNASNFDPLTDWQNIPFAIQQNYTPSILSSNRWYRRLLMSNGPQSCSQVNAPLAIISTSNITLVQGNSFIAPQISVGDDIFTCPLTPTPIAINAPISGGTPPFQFDWDFENFLNDDNVLNPIATIPSNTTFTLEVIDANGCVNFGQMELFAFALDAGTNTTICLGDTVQLGTLPNVGEPAIYSWSPSTGLSCSNCPYPLASPTVTTTYTITKSITLPDGTICSYSDSVTISLPQPPTSIDDVVVCHDEVANTFPIGNQALPGYNYSWFPQQWLNDYNVALPTFNSLNYFLFNTSPQFANPFMYVRTTTDGTCTWTDTMNIYMIRASIGEDGCLPTDLGYDWHPQIPATYSWTCLSGDCNFAMPLDGPTNHIESSTSQTAVVQLEVCYQGVCCTDVVEVRNCNEGSCQGQSDFCTLSINYDSICPILPLTLTAVGEFSGLPSFVDPNLIEYFWSPTANFSNPNASTTSLISNTEDFYVVYISHPFLPGEFCWDTIAIPAVVPPVFNPSGGALCHIGDSVAIGSQAISNYLYSWTGPSGQTFAESNPVVNVQGVYEYEVTDIITGCEIDSTVIVASPIIADAGPDQVVCPTSIAQIGTPDSSAGLWQYEWQPLFAPWQNGTDEFSPQPEVLVASNLTFILTVSDSITGCSNVDSVNLIIDAQGPSIEIEDAIVCSGMGVAIGPDPIFGALYSWSPSSGLSCDDCPNPIASPNVSTTFTVSIGLPGNCTPFVGEIMVSVINTPPLEISPILKCVYETVELNPSLIGLCAGCNYNWSPSSGLNSANLINPSCSTTSNVNYTLTVTDTNGCQQTGTVPVDISPALSINLASVAKCAMQPIALNPNGVGCVGCNYLWSPSNGLLSPTLQNPTTSSNQISQYTLTINYPDGCQEVGVVGVNIIPTFIHPPQAIEKCKISSVPLNPNLIGSCIGCTYNWSPSFGISSNSAINPNVTVQQNQIYTLTVTKPDGCLETMQVTVNVTPSVPIVIPPIEKCPSSSVPLNSTLVGQCVGCTYQWSPTTLLSSANTLNPNTSRTTNGIHTLTVTQPNGCQLTGSVLVTVIPTTILEIPTVYKCSNTTVPLNPDSVGICSGCTYTWSPSSFLSSTTNINPNTSRPSNGSYTLNVNNPNGCSATGNVPVLMDQTPITIPPVVRCNDGSSVSLNPSLVGECVGCSYFWYPSTGLSGNYIINPSTTSYNTSYSLTISLPNTCQETGVVNVSSAQPSAVNSSVSVCLGSSVPISVINPNLSSTYSWTPNVSLSNSTGTQTIYTANNANSQYLTLIENQVLPSGQTCVLNTPIIVNVLGTDLSSVNQNLNLCENSCEEIGLPAENGVSYFWSPTDDLSCSNCSNPLACPGENSQYTLTAIHNSSGCMSQTNVNLTLYEIAVPQTTLNDITVCDNQIVPLDLQIDPPGQYVYSWTPANLVSNPSIQSPSVNTSNLALGNTAFTVNVTDNFTGCAGIIDSILINVINNSQNINLLVNSCGPYTSSTGLIYENSGIYNYLVPNSFGCDSSVTLNLTINQPTSAIVNMGSCESFTWPLNGNTYTESGSYTTILQNATGCDSIVTLNLTINQSTNSFVNVSACESYTWPQTGLTYNESGSYIDFNQNAEGCDSLVTLNLTINQPTSAIANISSCESYTWPLNGITYTQSGSFSAIIQNAAGCDSLVTINLTIVQPSYSSINQNACDEYYWSAINETLTESGVYTTLLTNIAGCDSIVTLNLIISDFSVDVIITNNTTLTASAGITFQWVNCPLFDAIPSATNQIYSITQNGHYAVIATDASGCVDTSLCVYSNGVGIENQYLTQTMIYPNPTFDHITIEFIGAHADLELYEAQGKLVRKATILSGDQLSLVNEPCGVYFVRIISETGSYIHRVVKQR